MNERKKIGKKIVIVFGIIMGIFLIINAVWFFSVKTRYNNLTEKLDKVVQTEDEREEGINRNSYVKTENGYTYKVKGPDYLHNTGFLYIGAEGGIVYEIDENGDVISDNQVFVSLFIWPEIFGGYSFGIDVDWGESWCQINVDENGEYIPTEGVDPDEQEELKQLLEENREEVDKLFELADEMWDIR